MSDDKNKEEGLTPEEFEKAYQEGEKWADKIAKDAIRAIEKYTGKEQPPPDEELRKAIRYTFILTAIDLKNAELYKKREEERRRNDSDEWER